MRAWVQLLLAAVAAAVAAATSETWDQYRARTRGTAKERERRDVGADGGTLNSRQKRTVAFPVGSVFSLTPLFCIPVMKNADVSGTLHIQLPFNIRLPNSTLVSAAIGRGEGRQGLFSVMMEAMRRFGLDGRRCLLRTICEVAETPLKDDGLLGEIINILFSVSADLETGHFSSPSERDSSKPSEGDMNEFNAAEYYGKSYGDCEAVYPECPVGLLRLMEE